MATVQESSARSTILSTLAASRDASKSVEAEAQDRFLKLLVTQMQNQDPLNPLDNAQVTSQLAQISTVTGLDKLNQTLQSISAGFAANQTLQAASMIGRSVLVPGSEFSFSGQDRTLGVELSEPADRVNVNIEDAGGNIVRQFDLGDQDAGVATFTWDGVLSNGASAPHGTYRLSVSAVRGGKNLEAVGLSQGQVTSVSRGTQGLKLHVGGVGAVELTDIRQII